MPGKLYLIPSTIGDAEAERVIPEYIKSVINNITTYIVENERTARRMLIKLGITTPIDDLEFFVLNKHTNSQDIPGFFKDIDQKDIGLLSEAGVPAVADPGSEIVHIAHNSGVEVVPLVGPSSILLAMMASGMNGQNFAFIGYLPVKPQERVRRLKQLEQRSQQENQSQIFIEAPYRNNQLLKDILANCQSTTELCIACNITSENALIKTLPLGAWKKQIPELHKQPTIFILHSRK